MSEMLAVKQVSLASYCPIINGITSTGPSYTVTSQTECWLSSIAHLHRERRMETYFWAISQKWSIVYSLYLKLVAIIDLPQSCSTCLSEAWTDCAWALPQTFDTPPTHFSLYTCLTTYCVRWCNWICHVGVYIVQALVKIMSSCLTCTRGLCQYSTSMVPIRPVISVPEWLCVCSRSHFMMMISCCFLFFNWASLECFLCSGESVQISVTQHRRLLAPPFSSQTQKPASVIQWFSSEVRKWLVVVRLLEPGWEKGPVTRRNMAPISGLQGCFISVWTNQVHSWLTNAEIFW